MAGTEWFKYFNNNPKNRNTADDVVRALSLATNKPWENVLVELVKIGGPNGYMPTDNWTVNEYLAKYGFVKLRQPRKEGGRKYKGFEFCREIAMPNAVYVVHMGSYHTCTIIDKVIYDTYDYSNFCVGNYWIKMY